VLFHFAGLRYRQKFDRQGPKILSVLFGERASRIIIFAVTFAVLIYWINAFAKLMQATGFEFS